jgi:hypothetical protein
MLRQIPSNDHISNASTINTQPFQHLPKINNDCFNRKLARSKTFLTSNPHVSDIQNPPKKRSKVSLLICSQHNKEFIDDYKDIISDLSSDGLLEEYSSHFIDSNHIENIITNKDIEIYYYICLYGINFTLKTNIIVNDKSSINEVICLAVKQFNNEKFKINMEKGDYYLSINNDNNDYLCKICELRQLKKKTFQPKMDWPPFNGEAIIKDLNIDKFSFVVKDNQIISLISNIKWNDNIKDNVLLTENDNFNCNNNDKKCFNGCLII